MKTIITITSDPIGGTKVIVEVDDGEPVVVNTDPPRPIPGLKRIEHPLAPTYELDESTLPENHESNPEPATAPKKPKTGAVNDKRICEVCGTEFRGHKLAKTCSDECRKKKQRDYAAKHYKKKQSQYQAPAEKEVEWCKYCKAYTTHSTATHKNPIIPVTGKKPTSLKPDFLPGHEKSAKELEEWRTSVPGKPIPVAPAPPPSDFADPWDCLVCRNAGDLCTLHENMEKDGKRPPGHNQKGLSF